MKVLLSSEASDVISNDVVFYDIIYILAEFRYSVNSEIQNYRVS